MAGREDKPLAWAVKVRLIERSEGVRVAWIGRAAEYDGIRRFGARLVNILPWLSGRAGGSRARAGTTPVVPWGGVGATADARAGTVPQAAHQPLPDGASTRIARQHLLIAIEVNTGAGGNTVAAGVYSVAGPSGGVLEAAVIVTSPILALHVVEYENLPAVGALAVGA